MRKQRIVVFALGLGCAVPVAAASAGFGGDPRESARMEEIAGEGILGTLACAACLGSGAALVTMGWGPLYVAALGAADGFLAGACADACLSTL